MHLFWAGRLIPALLACILGGCSSTSDARKDSSPADVRMDSPPTQEAAIDLEFDATKDISPDKVAPADLATGDSGPCKPGEFVLKAMGKPKCIQLPKSVTLPVDSSQEADAIKKAAGSSCSCKCENGWTKQKGKWKCYCCTKYPDCLVEIDEATAATRCELYG